MALPDVRIVIVSWNVEKHLRACLASLPKACEGIVSDVVVVDNASADGSVEVAKRAGAAVIANTENRGFAAACNQGMQGSDARYVLLLNPDTECAPGSIAALVRMADAQPKVGIVGPKLLNTDGTTQRSVRRFPTLWSQLGIMLKVHHVFPWLFRRYFATDLSVDEEQDVDQVMGACFLIRRELIPQMGGLDERYFIWFEEVDYCRQAQKAGWTVRYLPSVHVTHHGGQSFGQVMGVKKQRMFDASLIAYFYKWHSRVQGMALRAVHPVAVVMAWLIEKRMYSGWVAAIVALEWVSRATIFHDTANGIATIMAALLVAIVSFKRPTLGLAILLLELLIGSHGRLLQAWGWPGVLSLRMALFIAFFAGWGAKMFGKMEIVATLKARWEWIVVAVMIGYGCVMGWMAAPSNVIADANAWMYALLLLPVMQLARTQGARLLRDVRPVLIVGLVWMALKAIGIEYLFAHGLAVVDPPTDFYLWIRRTGVGEITPLTPVIHRVFMQSQLFALPALFFGTAYYFATQEKGVWGRSRTLDVVLLASLIALIIGYSRSIWMGAAAGLIVLVAMFVKRWKSILWTGVHGVIIASIGVAMIVGATLFPIPSIPSLNGSGAVTGRLSATDAAVTSRWDLLAAMRTAIAERPLVGYGLGATLTYESSDPRVRAVNPSGAYTTYAFEWGWLDHWLKLGLFGLIAIVLLLVRISVRILKSPAERWMRAAGFASIVALAVTHFFTPYLNHPLGLGYLLMLEGWLAAHENAS